MSISLRKILMQELGVAETKKLLSISKLVRGNSRMTKTEKCECCVCKSKNIQLYPLAKDSQNIYNHHVMKVEYLAILVDKFKLYNEFNKSERILALEASNEENNKESNKENKQENLKQENNNYNYNNNQTDDENEKSKEIEEVGETEEPIKGYEYIKGFKPFCPRVAVCNDHHTMFHELVGDNPLYLVRDIKIDQAENIVEVFEKLSEEVKNACMVTSEYDLMKEYKDSYQRIWDETVTKSLIRLSACVGVNQIRATSVISDFIDEGDFDKYEKVLQKIDDIVDLTGKYDEERDITLPEVEIFNLNELEKIESDLSKYETIDKTMIALKDEIEEMYKTEETEDVEEIEVTEVRDEISQTDNIDDIEDTEDAENADDISELEG